MVKKIFILFTLIFFLAAGKTEAQMPKCKSVPDSANVCVGNETACPAGKVLDKTRDCTGDAGGEYCCVATVSENIGQPANVRITSLGTLISSLISAVFVIAGLICFVFLVWGGIQWITSGGDKAGVEAAQKRIQAAIVGLIIVFASWAIMRVLQDFLGIDIFKLAFPKPY